MHPYIAFPSNQSWSSHGYWFTDAQCRAMRLVVCSLLIVLAVAPSVRPDGGTDFVSVRRDVYGVGRSTGDGSPLVTVPTATAKKRDHSETGMAWDDIEFRKRRMDSAEMDVDIPNTPTMAGTDLGEMPPSILKPLDTKVRGVAFDQPEAPRDSVEMDVDNDLGEMPILNPRLRDTKQRRVTFVEPQVDLQSVEMDVDDELGLMPEANPTLVDTKMRTGTIFGSESLMASTEVDVEDDMGPMPERNPALRKSAPRPPHHMETNHNDISNVPIESDALLQLEKYLASKSQPAKQAG